jgi:hypothetical protein
LYDFVQQIKSGGTASESCIRLLGQVGQFELHQDLKFLDQSFKLRLSFVFKDPFLFFAISSLNVFAISSLNVKAASQNRLFSVVKHQKLQRGSQNPNSDKNSLQLLRALAA